MNDKVSELRKILNKKKAMEQMRHDSPVQQSFDPEQTLNEQQQQVQITGQDFLNDQTPDERAQSDQKGKAKNQPGHQVPSKNANDDLGGQNAALTEWQNKYEEVVRANQMQKEMYLAKAAEFENFKKRLQKEHDEFAKYANEKLILELLPVIDSLEMTLSHVRGNDNDPIAEGVGMIHKNILQTLSKFGVREVRGEGQAFDPHVQEAIGTEENDALGPDKVVTVHRSGFVLNGKVVRAALVTVSC